MKKTNKALNKKTNKTRNEINKKKRLQNSFSPARISAAGIERGRGRKFLIPGRTSEEDRIRFVEFWADYVRRTPDKVWSRQQRILIDSQMMRAKQCKLSPKEYLKIKGEPCSRR